LELKSKVEDMAKLKVIEPFSVKAQAISSGSEVTEMILRIDDVIAGTSAKGGGMPPGMGGGMPPGMGMD